ncbi:MAG: hypothetical protein LBT75_02445 [Bacilli bacterium]|jgi:alanyl-tRNA synthetase|nr:hypothetical protein [Bacilli bacterium]
MKTKVLYYDSIDLLDFEAKVISCLKNKDGLYEIILDQTAFYPEVGGMQHDIGTIDNKEIIKVIKKDDIIIHLSNDKIENENVKAHINKEKRFTNIQAHDAQHLISAIMELDYDLFTVSHHTFDNYYDLVLEGPPLNDDMIRACESKANDLIMKHAQMIVEVLNKDTYLSRGLPYNEKYGDSIRLTNIEYLNDNNACGCLHFNNMDRLSLVNILNYEKVRNQYRIIFTSGIKLNELLHDYYDLFSNIKLKLKANEDNVLEKIDNLLEKNSNQHNEIMFLKNKLFKQEIDRLLTSSNKIVYVNNELSFEELKQISNIVINSDNKDVIAYLQLKNNDKYQFIIVKQKDNQTNLSEIFTNLKNHYDINGGGRGLVINGQSNEDLSNIIKEYL